VEECLGYFAKEPPAPDFRVTPRAEIDSAIRNRQHLGMLQTNRHQAVSATLGAGRAGDLPATCNRTPNAGGAKHEAAAIMEVLERSVDSIQGTIGRHDDNVALNRYDLRPALGIRHDVDLDVALDHLPISSENVLRVAHVCAPSPR
jgi:hypothetical protein